MSKKKLLEGILECLKRIDENFVVVREQVEFLHIHADRMDTFFKMVHNIKEDGKTGVWIEDKKNVENEKDKASS